MTDPRPSTALISIVLDPVVSWWSRVAGEFDLVSSRCSALAATGLLGTLDVYDDMATAYVLPPRPSQTPSGWL